MSVPSYQPQGSLVGNFSDSVSAIRFNVAAEGGYKDASITIAGPLVEIEDWVERGLGRHVEIYDPALDVVFECFVNRLDVGVGPLAQTIGPLLDIGNRVSVIYSPILDADADPPVIGATQPTTIAEDALSQDRYGIVEKVLSGGTCQDDDAERYRDTYLAEHAWPESGEALTPGSGGEPTVRLECLGYEAFLDAYVYSTTTTGTTTASAKITAVIGADPNGLFSTDYGDIDTNAYLVAAYDDDNTFAKSIIQGIVALGDVSDNRWLFGIYRGRRAHYKQVPDVPDYVHRLSDPAQEVTLTAGGVVRPWNVRPGRWLFIPDWLIGRTEPTAMRRDPRYIFIESVEYSAPYGLRINGNKIGSLPQMLAKMGLGGASA